MSEPDRAVRVADPVHGYVLLTPIERALIDTAAAQRLRYVGQSGLAHLVFPEVRTSRFSHSLGTMHLASKFLAASLAHALDENREAALAGIKAAADEALGLMGDAEEAIAGLSRDALVSLDHVDVDESLQSSVLLVEQGLRLAALFHDLGHLPFSHDFEYAVEQLAKEPQALSAARPLLNQRPGQDALHERIGHDLTFLLLKSGLTLHSSSTREAARASFTIAQRILDTSEDEPGSSGGFESAAEGAFAWLHSLIANELDVDRCDYVLRDGRNYGFEFAAYDLRRLVDNLTVVVLPDVDYALLPAVRPHGQAAIETFLIARARMYQWGVRHHKVVQVGAALRHVTREQIGAVLAEDEASAEISRFIEDLEMVLAQAHDLDRHQANELLSRFARYDDGWWMDLLRTAADAHPEDQWLQLVCWRSEGPRSLWKRPIDFHDLVEFNQRLPQRTDIDRLADWDEAVRQLRDDGVLVVRHNFAPWKATPETEGSEDPQSTLSFVKLDNTLVPISEVSYPIRSLRSAWMHDLQVHAFARSDVSLTAADVVRKLEPEAEWG